MSDVVSTSVAALCHGQNHSGGVPVASVRVAAVIAPEDSPTQVEAVLGSRSAHRTGHGGVGGRYQHHPPARPPATLDQDPFRATDGRVCGLTGHGGPGQEPRFEVLHGDQLVVVHHGPGPDLGGWVFCLDAFWWSFAAWCLARR